MTAADAHAPSLAPQRPHTPLRLLVCGGDRDAGRTLIDALRQAQSEHGPRFLVTELAGGEHDLAAMLAAAPQTAVLRVDATSGLTADNRRHALLAAQLGIRHLVLAVDAAEPDEDAHRTIADAFAAFARPLGDISIAAIPLHTALPPWYAGPGLLDYLDALPRQPRDGGRLVFPVWQVAQLDDRQTIASGTVAEGGIRIGEEVRITGSGATARVAAILSGSDALERASAGDDVTLHLQPAAALGHGDILSLARLPLETTDQFEATLVWLDRDAGLTGRRYDIRLSEQTASASITAIKYRVDVGTLVHEAARKLERDDIAVCNIAVGRPLAFDSYEHSPALGGFALIDRFSRATVAVGMIRHSLRRAQNVHRQALSIARADREQLNGHRGKVVWFTGLSGSGKSTLANALEVELHRQGRRTYILDGDNVRQGLNKDLGFTDADRVENIRRIAEVARLMMDAGLIVMTAFISPFRRERAMARELIGTEHFIEVFVDTPLAVCEERDPKGLYKKARSGQLPNMTGINSPYEPPERPELVVDATSTTQEATVEALGRLIADH